MKEKIIITENTDEITEEIVKILFDLLSLHSDSPFHIALSGGNTPKKIFRHLTENKSFALPLEQIHFWWGDERCVPPSHEESNFRWANELWLAPALVPEKNIHRIYGENNPEKEAIRYSEEIAQYLPVVENLPRFDFILLGIGEDGHTASIFPDQMELLTSDTICKVATHPLSGQKRITLTGKAINHARVIGILITGTAKTSIAPEIILKRNKTYPASHIRPVNGEIIWLLDSPVAKSFNSIPGRSF